MPTMIVSMSDRSLLNEENHYFPIIMFDLYVDQFPGCVPFAAFCEFEVERFLPENQL